jgi:hypothetical protein
VKPIGIAQEKRLRGRLPRLSLDISQQTRPRRLFPTRLVELSVHHRPRIRHRHAQPWRLVSPAFRNSRLAKAQQQNQHGRLTLGSHGLTLESRGFDLKTENEVPSLLRLFSVRRVIKTAS